MNNLIQKINAERLLWLIVLWQLISVTLVAIGVWPQQVAWINLSVITLYIIVNKPYNGLLLFIASVPFYLVLPNPYFDSLSMWRPLALILVMVTFVSGLVSQRHFFQKIITITRTLSIPDPEIFHTFITRFFSRFMWWDKYLALFVFIILLSAIVARFPGESLKQLFFLLNLYLIYIVVIFSVTTKQQVIKLSKYLVASTGTIVFLGYVQLFSTLFTSQYYFWQYWAVMVSKAYYGLGLANVLVYSNSWFSYTGDSITLRMFSIMPDSHSFGMIAVFLMCLLIPLTYHYAKAGVSWKNWKEILVSKNYHAWSLIRFAGLAVIFSGTRGLWVGMLPALVVSVFLYIRNYVRPVIKKSIIAFVLVILFFVLSPLINQGLNLIRAGVMDESFLDRAASIYDLNESSNVGRLIIWRDSLVYAVKHPFGVGYGNFIVSLVHDIPENASFEQAGDLKNLRYNLPQKFVTAHSLFLNILVELGLAGLLAFCLLIFEIFFRIWRFIRNYPSDSNIFTAQVVMFGLMLIWFLGYGLFDVTLFNDRVLLYFLITLALTGLIIRRYDSYKQEEWVEGQNNG
jgi:O-antigen ligase